MVRSNLKFRACGVALAFVSLAAVSGYTATALAARHAVHHVRVVRVVRVRTAQNDGLAFQFAQCMRAHGAAQPDPAPVPGRTGLALDIVDNGPNVVAARQACQPILDQLTSAKAQAIGPAGLAARQRQAQQFVACMSAHGVDLGQPQPPLYDVGALLDAAQRETSKAQAPALEAAKEACLSVNPDFTG